MKYAMRAVLAVLIVVRATPAQAQRAGPRGFAVHRITMTVGGGVLGGAAVGTREADLRANGDQPQPYALFSSSTRFGASPMAELRIGVALSRRVVVEGRGSFNRPALRTSVSGDLEGAPALTVVERVDQYVIGGGVLVMLHEARIRGMVPFAAAGAGYVRQLHEGLTLVDHGHTFDVGGGIVRSLFSRDRGVVRAAGLRADARLYLLSGGVTFRTGPRPHGAISGSAFVAF
jgi:hypothetical protein